MNRLRSAHVSRFAALLALGAALLVPGSVRAAWLTNTVELDPGSCGQLLQIGSDRTASSSATPSFLLRGNGGLSSYAMRIDGTPIGTFASNGFAVVCVTTSTPLAQGPHTLTGSELAPQAGSAVTPLGFSVDTVAPAAPSAPVLSAYKDSGALGDGITKFKSINVTGTAGADESVQISSNGVGLAGARADSTGHWSATTVTLNDGSYLLAAVAVDTAGNRSALSERTRVRVDSVAPPTPAAHIVASSDGTVLGGRVAPDVTTVRVFSNGTEVGVAVPSRTHRWQFALSEPEPGSHTIAVSAADAADNVTPLSAGLTLTIDPTLSAPDPDDPDLPTPPAGGSRAVPTAVTPSASARPRLPLHLG